jgi:hypothetical protein
MAILNRLQKRGNVLPTSFKKYLLYAVGEVVLIFAGITLSLWFSNWNDDKKEREVEVNLLKEFRQGLISDAEDVRFNISVREGARAACKEVITLMETKSPYHDSLDILFAKCFQLTGTLTKTSPYENLKSRGLQTIKNDTLRTKIIDLHDLAYHHVRHRREVIMTFFLISWCISIRHVFTPVILGRK